MFWSLTMRIEAHIWCLWHSCGLFWIDCFEHLRKCLKWSLSPAFDVVWFNHLHEIVRLSGCDGYFSKISSSASLSPCFFDVVTLMWVVKLFCDESNLTEIENYSKNIDLNLAASKNVLMHDFTVNCGVWCETINHWVKGNSIFVTSFPIHVSFQIIDWVLT